MKIEGRRLSKEDKAFIRRVAAQRVRDGESPGAVMDSYRLSRMTIFPWLRKADAEGIDALAPRRRTGRRRETDARGRAGGCTQVGDPLAMRASMVLSSVCVRDISGPTSSPSVWALNWALSR